MVEMNRDLLHEGEQRVDLLREGERRVDLLRGEGERQGHFWNFNSQLTVFLTEY